MLYKFAWFPWLMTAHHSRVLSPHRYFMSLSSQVFPKFDEKFPSCLHRDLFLSTADMLQCNQLLEGFALHRTIKSWLANANAWHASMHRIIVLLANPNETRGYKLNLHSHVMFNRYSSINCYTELGDILLEVSSLRYFSNSRTGQPSRQHGVIK